MTAPIKNIVLQPQDGAPLRLRIILELGDHVAACCLTPESAFVEFFGDAGRARSTFTLREHKPAHLLEAEVELPGPGTYRYHLFAKLLGQPLSREGTYSTQP